MYRQVFIPSTTELKKLSDTLTDMHAVFSAMAWEAKTSHKRLGDKAGMNDVVELETQGRVILDRLKQFVENLESKARDLDRRKDNGKQ